MTWNKDPDKAFPARHPREPGGLRQDILDEIADHLACAAEREQERQENENEEAVWSRVLERFGNPDAIARKLWWDKMWEAVMREWIQTGVMVVVTIAVLAGLAMMTRLVAGVGTANEAMREAMKQVAASNENLAKAMAEQRAGNEAMLKAISGIQVGGGEKPDALELSTIEIVVRRGTPEGPPAPEVKVKMRGQGPGESSLLVEGELDASGRAVFERLYQGKYTFLLEDPRSGLFGERTVTLFAGKGAGEHVAVAPDVMPRPINVDLGLPQYGRDSDQLIGTVIEAEWSYEDHHWASDCEVVIGREGTLMLGGATADAWHNRTREKGGRSLDAAIPCTLAGDIRVTEQIMILRPAEELGVWWTYPQVSIGPGAGAFPNAHIESFEIATIADGQFSGVLPVSVMGAYDRYARNILNCENVPAEKEGDWMAWAASHYTDSVVTSSRELPEVRLGEWREGSLYAIEPGRITYIGSVRVPSSADCVALFALPDVSALKFSEGQSLDLVVAAGGVGKVTLKTVEDARNTSRRPLVGVNDASGNILAAYAVRGDWRNTTWPMFSAETRAPGALMTMDEKPFWQSASEVLKSQVDESNKLIIPLSHEMLAAGGNPVTGVLVRWEKPSGEFAWSLNVGVDGEAPGTPRVIVTGPIATAAEQPDGKALTDIDDGRFHFDKEVFAEPLTPQEPIAQPAP